MRNTMKIDLELCYMIIGMCVFMIGLLGKLYCK